MYVRKGEIVTAIPSGWKQVFASPFTLSVGQKEIVKMKNAGTITDRDLDIAKLLFKFRFATLEQILRYLNHLEDSEGKTSASVLKNRLDKLITYKVINKFMISKDALMDKIQPDALEIYCLDLGGRYLLTHYSNEDTTDWYSVVNMKTSEHVAKNITTLNFYLTLLTTSHGKVEYFNVEPELRVGKKVVIPAFELSYVSDGLRHFFIGEVVKTIDFPVQFREKAQKLNSLLETDAWKKYCMDAVEAPILFVITDSDQLAGHVARHIEETTEIRRYRMSTDDRIMRAFTEKGAFLRYKADQSALLETSAKVFG